MGCPLLMFRPLASMVLGLVAFLAFFAYLFFNLVDGHVLSTDFYAEALYENEVYARLYDEVLVDPALEDEAKELLGNVDVPQEDVAAVAKRIMPPAYLQQETERTLDGLIDYLKRDTDDLDLYIELAEPLENASKELVVYAERRIDEIEVQLVDVAQANVAQVDVAQADDPAQRSPDLELPIDPSSPLPDAGELAQQALETIREGGTIQVEQIELETEEDWAKYWEDTLRELERGQLPSQVPSLANVDVEERLEGYDLALEELHKAADVPQEVLDALDDPDTDGAIREALSSEDPFEEQNAIKGALKAVSRGVLPPLIDDTLDDVRRELVTPEGMVCKDVPEGGDLSRCTRYDLLELVDGDLEGSEGLDDSRDGIRLFSSLGGWLPLVVLAVACLGIIAVNVPRIVSIFRWLGIVLSLTGLFYLILGMLVGSTVADRLDSALQDAWIEADAPESLLPIFSDVTSHMADSLSLALTSPSVIMMIVGVLFFITSLFIRRIPIVSRIPFIGSLLG